MKFIPVFIIALMAFSVSALAVEEQPKVLIKPCNWLYPLKTASENFKLVFLSDENELIYRTELADNRLHEIEQESLVSCPDLTKVEEERQKQLEYIDLLLDKKFESLSNETRDKLLLNLEKHKIRVNNIKEEGLVEVEGETGAVPNEKRDLIKQNLTEHPLGLLRAIQVHEIAKERFTDKVEEKGIALKAQSISALDKLKIKMGIKTEEEE